MKKKRNKSHRSQKATSLKSGFGRLRARIWRRHPGKFRAYSQTASIASIIWKKTKGVSPRSNKKLATLIRSAAGVKKKTAFGRKRKPVIGKSHPRSGRKVRGGKKSSAKGFKKRIKGYDKKAFDRKIVTKTRYKKGPLTYIVRLNRVRARVWHLSPESFENYQDTAKVAACILAKNDGKMPRSNKKLILLMKDCLPFVPPPPPPPKSPCDDPAPVIEPDILGEYDYFQIPEVIENLPEYFPHLFISPLSSTYKFKRYEYSYFDTFKLYLSHVNKYIDNLKQQGIFQGSGTYLVTFELRCNPTDGWHIYIYESGEDTGFVLLDSDDEAADDELVPDEGPSDGEEDQPLDDKKTKDEIIAEIDHLDKLRKDAVAEKDKLMDEFKIFKELGDTESMKKIGASINQYRDIITELVRQINKMIKKFGRTK